MGMGGIFQVKKNVGAGHNASEIRVKCTFFLQCVVIRVEDRWRKDPMTEALGICGLVD